MIQRGREIYKALTLLRSTKRNLRAILDVFAAFMTVILPVMFDTSAAFGLQVGPKAPALEQTPPNTSKQRRRSTTSSSTTKKPANITVSIDITSASNWVRIPAGEFMMGSTRGYDDEMPVHRVRISRGFEIGKYEVTQAQWEAVMGSNPSYFKGVNLPSYIKGASLPVESVSWADVQQFIEKLNVQKSSYIYRLPTEAEWEYACRAGSTGDFAGNLNAMVWHTAIAGGHPHPVGQKQPNAWGLYDMHGNVWEWCSDWFDPNYYAQGPSVVVDPQGMSIGSERVYRGGGWATGWGDCRSAVRGRAGPDIRHFNLGLRLVRVLRDSITKTAA